MKKNRYDVIVVGGGPAGLSAAMAAAGAGVSVLVVEKTPTCGRKLLISGSGRCNITNTINNVKQLVSQINNGRFLYQAFNGLTTADVTAYFNSRGLRTVVERGTKVFPATGGSADVLRILMSSCASSGVEFSCGTSVTDIEIKDGWVTGVLTQSGRVECSAIIIATGGMSYPKTGSSGDGYAFAERAGHTVITPRPALVPAYTDEEWIKGLDGLTLKDAGLCLIRGGRQEAKAAGDMLFTDRGVSGPAVYDISRLVSAQDGDSLCINLFPDETPESLDKRLAEDININNKKIIRNIIDGYAPSAIVPAVFNLSGVDGETRAARLGAADRKKLVKTMKALPLRNVRFAGFERAVVTAGGVDTREIDGRTMMSRKSDGLFFAGEVIDVDGPTGGYNLQICWSTGKMAGLCAAAMAKKRK